MHLLTNGCCNKHLLSRWNHTNIISHKDDFCEYTNFSSLFQSKDRKKGFWKWESLLGNLTFIKRQRLFWRIETKDLEGPKKRVGRTSERKATPLQLYKIIQKTKVKKIYFASQKTSIIINIASKSVVNVTAFKIQSVLHIEFLIKWK